MKVATIVVTYNRKELLQESIERLLHQSKKDVQDIIIIDNASSDGTKESISKYIETNKIKYINTGSNLGSSGGFQYGIRYGAEHEYDYIWVMDDDCMPSKTSLEELIEANNSLNGEYGFLSSKVLWTDGEICKMNVQRKTLTRYVRDFTSEKVEVIMASFVSLFLPINTVRLFGLPIKEFFIWTDDWEYTRRISKKMKCYLVNRSVVEHKSASNIGANIAIDTKERLERYKYIYRNDVYLYKREGLKGIAYLVCRNVAHILRVIFKAKDNKLKRIKIIITSTIGGIKFKPQIETVAKNNGDE